MIEFEVFFTRVQQATPIATQHDLAKALNVHRSAITQAKRRNSVPQKWVLTLSRSFQLSADWLEFGVGKPEILPPYFVQESTATCTVPKIYARLCVGEGSFEIEATPIEEHIFKQSWLEKKGTPSAMVLMDVTGDSMEPFICQGDTVLVDQSQTTIQPNIIYAVGIDDSIMIKRVLTTQHNVTLTSDNSAYAPIKLQGDELLTFRIIGKIVWSSRDY